MIFMCSVCVWIVFIWMITVLITSVMGWFAVMICNQKYCSMENAPQILKESNTICYENILIPFINVYYGLLFIIKTIKN